MRLSVGKELAREVIMKWNLIGISTSLTCKQAKVSPKNSVFPFESRQIRSKRPKTSVLLWFIVKMIVQPVLASFFNVTIIKRAETLK